MMIKPVYLVEKTKEIHQMVNHFEYIQDQIQDLEDSIEDLQSQADTLAQEITDLEQRVAQNEGNITINIGDIDALKTSTQELGSTLSTLAATVAANEDHIEQKLSDFQGLYDTYVAGTQTYLSDLDKRIETNSVTLIAHIYDADQAMQGMKATLNDLVFRVGSLETTSATKTALVNSINDAKAWVTNQLSLKQNRIWSYCGTGYAIRQVHFSGGVS